MTATTFLLENWACAPSDGTQVTATTESTACISLSAVADAEIRATAFSDGINWSDGTIWSDYPDSYLQAGQAA